MNILKMAREGLRRELATALHEAVAHKGPVRRPGLRVKTNGECIFLTADNLCRIHAEHGYTEKPLSCQLFPFSLEPEGEGFRVTVRFDCPAVAKSVGGPPGQYRQDVARIASAFMAAGLPELSRTQAQRLIEEGWVKVAGKAMTKPAARLDREVFGHEVTFD